MLESLLRRAATLTEYAWKFRYPGDPDEPSDVEAGEALGLAREVYDALVSRLPHEANPEIGDATGEMKEGSAEGLIRRDPLQFPPHFDGRSIVLMD